MKTHALIRSTFILAVALLFTAAVSMTRQTDIPAVVEEPGVRFHRSVSFVSGQAEEATKFAREITEYVKDKFPSIPVEVFIEMGSGASGTLHWFVDVNSEDELHKMFNELGADAGFNQKLEEGGSIFSSDPWDEVMVRL